MNSKQIIITLLLAFCCSAISAQVDARLFQYPDVSSTHIAFSYGGDIWTVEKDGGIATKLTSAKGN